MTTYQCHMSFSLHSDLPEAASTGPASEAPLLVPDGPSAGLSPGGTSCLACEPLHPAAKTEAYCRNPVGTGQQSVRSVENVRYFMSTLTGCCWLRRRLRSCGLAPGLERRRMGP